jgi:threonine dehydrogenase-like Zn-dependent dehydrogenase
MKALSIDRPGTISTIDIPVPTAGPGEVLLTVSHIGYCGSDLTSFKGLNPLVTYPRVPGHEIAATVRALGEGVGGLALGQAVTVLPYFNCGTCNACRMGRTNACKRNQTMGVQREGALAAQVAVPADKVIAVTGMAQRDLALIEPCAVGFHAVRRGRVDSADTVVVLGCGMIGLGVVLGSLRRGARVIAVDLSAAKLAVAKKLGAGDTIDASCSDVAAEVARLTGEDGPSVVIEAVGADVTFRQAIDLVGSCGRVVYVGYAKAPVSYDTKQFLLKEMDILGSRGAQRTDFDDVIETLKTRPEVGDLIVSKVVGFGEAGAAMQAWNADPGAFIKIMITLPDADHE